MNKNGHRVLILSGSYGDGHKQAAEAIRREVLHRYPGAETVLLDFMEWTHPFTNTIGRYMFLKGLQTFPSAYGYVYNKTREANMFSYILKRFNRLGLGRMLKLLEEVEPTVVVSTFPPAAGAMSAVRAYGLYEVPTVTVITDHTDHSYWVYPETDKYLVGSGTVLEGLIHAGVSRDKIEVTGIPIRPEFHGTYERSQTRTKLGLDPEMPTVLFMGGGCGMMGSELHRLEAIESLPVRTQLVIVCGSNEKLRSQITDLAGRTRHRIIATGYVNNVHEWMAAADLLVTKPGGLTISEAMAMKLPIVIYKALPGQEEDNARFLLASGVAVKAGNMTGLIGHLDGFLRNPSLLSAMRSKLESMERMNASAEAVRIMLQTRTQRRYAPVLQEIW
ncbi:glycosyltransferase [Paenibacillus sp. FJAT-26967]|uniref:MGDG synthase family glycosyltransferase n=1 Tax=Paenibacillus sp. FJAT-26967 TaxID=1729690 RepID=UPI00083951BA|nr:glycosyltransferase [Paenibacillus sp. FJAT-26967]